MIAIPRLPAPVQKLVGALPQFPHSAALAAALNVYARDLFGEDEIAGLEGKIVRLHVRDAGVRVTLRIGRTGYTPCRSDARADATVSADAREFVLLALGSVDPDTLFFDRRLTISGDTDVGLIVKNALDRMAPPLPERALRFLRTRFG